MTVKSEAANVRASDARRLTAARAGCALRSRTGPEVITSSPRRWRRCLPRDGGRDGNPRSCVRRPVEVAGSPAPPWELHHSGAEVAAGMDRAVIG